MSGELISRDELLRVMEKSTYVTSRYFGNADGRVWIERCRVFNVINGAPAVDAVEVVRCRDCRHHDPENGNCDCGCWHMPYKTNDDEFCSYGERMDGGAEE